MPVQVPAAAVSVWPETAEPAIDAATVLSGATAPTTSVGSDAWATFALTKFDASTLIRSFLPVSAGTTV
jgi:hypothetical protein